MILTPPCPPLRRFGGGKLEEAETKRIQIPQVSHKDLAVRLKGERLDRALWLAKHGKNGTAVAAHGSGDAGGVCDVGTVTLRRTGRAGIFPTERNRNRLESGLVPFSGDHRRQGRSLGVDRTALCDIFRVTAAVDAPRDSA